MVLLSFPCSGLLLPGEDAPQHPQAYLRPAARRRRIRRGGRLLDADIVQQYVAQHLRITDRLDAVEGIVRLQERKERVRPVFHRRDFPEQMLRVMPTARTREVRVDRRVEG